MKKVLFLFLLSLLLAGCQPAGSSSTRELPPEGPIQLHPLNPHYFLYRGRALALITSAEHYGAVLNLDFDYRTYLKTLAEAGMNYTRIFTGSYFEIEGESFGIRNNTLAPAKGSIITPWGVVVDSLSGIRKYDLSVWNEAYFRRLKDFLTTAASYDIIVEVTLFSSIYRDEHWDLCPQNPANNVNIPHEVTRFEAQTLDNGDLLSYQLDFVRKMVDELHDFDNFFFEIQNEPWSDHPVPVYNIVNKEELRANDWSYKADFASEASLAWQKRIASVIVEEEKGVEKKHLIAQNFTNFRAPIPGVSDAVSIMNFHYAWPDAVAWNYSYDRVIGFDESGFAGSGDRVYRRQAWQFILSGGGLFNNLDYSFFVGSEDGLGENRAPGGGSATLRSQLKILSDFFHGFDIVSLHPDPTAVKSVPGAIPYVLSDRAGTYAIYVRAVGTDRTLLRLNTGDGNFQIRMLNTITGVYAEAVTLPATGGILEIDLTLPEGELALKITRE